MQNVDRAAGYEYRPGFPEFRMVVSSFIDENDNTQLNVAIEIVKGSLIYKKKNGLFEANGLLDIQILDRSTEANTISSIQEPIKITGEEQNLVVSQDTYLYENEFAIKPGDYQIIATLTDNITNKETIRSDEAFIPNPRDETVNITNIRILSKDSTPETSEALYSPVTTYDIPNLADSLKFVFQVTNNKADKPMTLTSRLIKFESDTSSARQLNGIDYRVGNLAYRGIDYDKRETISSSRRVLTDPGSVLIEFAFPKLERGNYRLEVSSMLNDDE